MKQINKNSTFQVLEFVKENFNIGEDSQIFKNIKRRTFAINVLNNINKAKTTEKELLFVFESEGII